MVAISGAAMMTSTVGPKAIPPVSKSEFFDEQEMPEMNSYDGQEKGPPHDISRRHNVISTARKLMLLK
jgi:hypothetical protein